MSRLSSFIGNDDRYTNVLAVSIMGIKSLRDALLAIDPGIFVPVRNNARYQHVMIDGNAQLHTAVHRMKGKRLDDWVRVRKIVMQVFRNTLSQATPTVSLTVLLDGVAPVAKLREQRRRRAGCKPTDGSILLTPGTMFMKRISTDLASWLKTLVSPNVAIHVSGIDEPGEGELKMCRYCAGVSHNRRSVCCVSADHDMISIMMANPSMRHCSFVLQRSDGAVYVRFRRIHRFFSHPRDLTILCCLAGNDYLPRIGDTTIQRIFRAYMDLSGSTKHRFMLVDRSRSDGRPHGPSLQRLFRRLSTGRRPPRRSTPRQIQRYLDGLSWCCRQYCLGICEDPWFRTGPAVFPSEMTTGRLYFNPPTRSCYLTTAEAALVVVPPNCCEALLPSIRSWTEPTSPLHRWFVVQTCDDCVRLKQRLSAIGKRHGRNPSADTLKELREANRAMSLHQMQQHVDDRIDFNELLTNVVAAFDE